MIQYLHRSFFLFVLLVCAMSASAPAQVVTPLPATLYQDPGATIGPAIDAFVSGNVAKMSKSEPAAARSARESLISTVVLPGASPAFLDAYTATLDKALLPLAQNPDPRVRLNAAIVAARVAAKVGNARLLFSTVAFVQSKDDAVALWGIQAAKYVVPALAQNTNLKMAVKIDEEVVAAAREHQGSVIAQSSLTEETYRTLTFDPTVGSAYASPNPLANIPVNGIKATLPILFGFMDYRVKLYADAVPAQPLADAWGARYLVNPAVWSQQTPAQQKQTIGLMLDLLKGASKQIAQADSPELHDLLTNVAKGFEALYGPLGPLNNKPVYDAAHAVAILPASATSPAIDAKIDALQAAMK